MAELLSDYEKQRLANIARNQSVLEELGLAKKKERDDVISKPKQQPKPNVPVQPSRVLPRRGQGIQNYSEYFAQQYDALDELEKDEKERMKHERKSDNPDNPDIFQFFFNAKKKQVWLRLQQTEEEAHEVHLKNWHLSVAVGSWA